MDQRAKAGVEKKSQVEICTKKHEETLQGFERVEAEGLYEQHSLTVSVDGVAFSELGALAVVLPFIY